MRNIALHFSFLVMSLSLSNLGIRFKVASQYLLGNIHLSSIFLKNFCKIGIISSLSILQYLLEKLSGPNVFFLRRF